MVPIDYSGRPSSCTAASEYGPRVDSWIRRMNEMSRVILTSSLCRDISFIRMIADQARGPWSEAAVRSDEGRPP